MENKLSPASVWENFDATSMPLETEEVFEEVVDGIRLQGIYFNGEGAKDGVSRVFAMSACKKNATSLPALLLVLGSGKAIDREQLMFWASKGFAVLAVDNYGKVSFGEHFTKYPRSLEFCNFQSAGRAFTHVDSTVQKTAWYHWVVNTRRALTYLSQQSFVDSQSIGLVSFEDGVIVASQVAAFDSRVSATGVLFGNCYHDCTVEAQDVTEMDDKQLSDYLNRVEEKERWLGTIAPQSYLPHIITPFYLCIGSNSSKSDLSKNDKAFSSLPKETARVMWVVPRSVNANDNIVLDNLHKWLNMKLKKQIDIKLLPAVDFFQVNDRLEVVATVPDQEAVSDFNVYVSRGANRDHVRNWFQPNMVQVADGVFRGGVEIFDDSTVKAFCNFKYLGKIYLTGNIVSIDKSKLKHIKRQKNVKKIYDSTKGLGEFTKLSLDRVVDGNFVRNHPVTLKEGPFGIWAATGSAMGIFSLSDPKMGSLTDEILTLDIFSENKQAVNVGVVCDFEGKAQKSFFCKVELLGGDLWQKVIVKLEDLKGQEGGRISAWSKADAIVFEGEQEFSVNNIRLA